MATDQASRPRRVIPTLFDFGVVIPHLDYSENLLVCLRSVLMQEGSFTAQVHIQDGGTADTARELAGECEKWMDSGRFLLTYAKEPDSGAAQAINRGLSEVNARMLTWLGADDMLMPGAFEAVGTLIEQHPKVEWVTGLPHLVSQFGIPLPNNGSAGFYRFPTGFSTEALKRGLHAGHKNHGFIQQEGTFWSSSLWEKVGGLDESLRLAFDFDLWCRLAEHSDLLEVVAPLGAFRKRPGQASENMAAYLAETAGLREKYLQAFGGLSTGIEPTCVAFIDYDTQKWHIGRRSFAIVGQGARVRTPHMAQGMLRFAIAAWLRQRADTSTASRFALRVLSRLRKWRQL